MSHFIIYSKHLKRHKIINYARLGEEKNGIVKLNYTQKLCIFNFTYSLHKDNVICENKESPFSLVVEISGLHPSDTRRPGCYP